MTSPEGARRRHSPRVAIALACTLRRRSGSAIAARTRDLGPGGMHAVTSRPLAVDEVVTFEIRLGGDLRAGGRARVLRHESHGGYALRFEGLSDPILLRLADLAERGVAAGASASTQARTPEQPRRHAI